MSDKISIADKAIEFVRFKQRKTKTEIQFLNLVDKENLSAPEIRLLDALRAEQVALQRTRDAKKERSRVLAQHRKSESEIARKARTHAMIEAAGLMAISGLIDTTTGQMRDDPDVLLGALEAVRTALENPDKANSFREHGKAAFERHARQKAGQVNPRAGATS